MNHCWRVWKVPVSSWKWRIVQQSGSALRWSERQTENLPPDRWSRTGAHTLRLSWGPGRGFLDCTHGCYEPQSVGEASLWLWGWKRSPAPNSISTERLKRLPCPGQRAELSLFFQPPLSFNRIRLLIILWTSLTPYFNLSWRAGEIREGECCFGPSDLSRTLQCERTFVLL